MTENQKYLVLPFQQRSSGDGTTMLVDVDIVSDSVDTYSSILYPNGCQTTTLSNVVIDYNHNMKHSGSSLTNLSLSTKGRQNQVLSGVIEVPLTAVLRSASGTELGNMQEAITKKTILAVSVSFSTFAYQVSDNYAINILDNTRITELEYNQLSLAQRASYVVHYVKWDMLAIAFLDVPPGQNEGSAITGISYRSFGHIQQNTQIMNRTYIYTGDLYSDSSNNPYICVSKTSTMGGESSYTMQNIVTGVETTYQSEETENFKYLSIQEVLLYLLKDDIKDDQLESTMTTEATIGIFRKITQYQKNRCFCLEYLYPQRFYVSPTNDLVEVLEATETEVKVKDIFTNTERSIVKPETEDLTSEWETYRALDVTQLYTITSDEEELAEEDITDSSLRSLTMNLRACTPCEARKKMLMAKKNKVATTDAEVKTKSATTDSITTTITDEIKNYTTDELAKLRSEITTLIDSLKTEITNDNNTRLAVVQTSIEQSNIKMRALSTEKSEIDESPNMFMRMITTQE